MRFLVNLKTRRGEKTTYRHINRIEADDGCVETDVCFGDFVAIVIGAGGGGEVLLNAV
jgi:hypothetical protein